MKATDIIRQEHRVIVSVLECLNAATEHVEAGGRLDADSFRAMLDFLRIFAGRCHAEKEAAHFFPMARLRGIGCEPGNLDTLLAEHEEGLARIGAIEESLSGIERGDSDARAKLYEHARRQVVLFIEHTEMEDDSLLPRADTMLSASDQQELLRAFEKIDAKELGPAGRKPFCAFAEQLRARWGLPPRTGEWPHTHHGHS